MFQYAIYYFQRAAKANPNDSRMWTALGDCYIRTDKVEEAIKCYKKAIDKKDKDGIALTNLAKLYEKNGDTENAFECHKVKLTKVFQNEVDEDVEKEDIIDSVLFCAIYLKNKGNYEECIKLINKVKDYEGQVIIN